MMTTNSDGALRRISVIVVNYGTAMLAIDAVQSVLDRDHGGRTVDVHLVDNASPEDDAAKLTHAHTVRDWAGRVTIHAESVNHGFGGGNNVVFDFLLNSDAPPDAVFLLNPDARLDNEAIDILARTLETEGGTAFAGAGISLPDGTPVTAAFRFPSVIGEFSRALNFGPVSRLCRDWEISLPPDFPAGPVDWVSGAAVMIRWDALCDINFFDPAYFLYFEEVDLMRQGAKHGWATLHVPDARVIHAEGMATGVRSKRDRPRRHPAYRYRSWQYYFSKNHGRTGAALVCAAVISGSTVNHLVAGLRGRRAWIVPHFFQDFWRHFVLPTLGLDKRADDRRS